MSNVRRLLDDKNLVRKELIKVAAELSEFALLKSIPGIGELTSSLLLVELGDVHRFKTNKQLNAFVEIDIRRYQSGTIYKRDRIQKRGNKRARMILYYTIKNMNKQQKYIENNMICHYHMLMTKDWSFIFL